MQEALGTNRIDPSGSAQAFISDRPPLLVFFLQLHFLCRPRAVRRVRRMAARMPDAFGPRSGLARQIDNMMIALWCVCHCDFQNAVMDG